MTSTRLSANEFGSRNDLLHLNKLLLRVNPVNNIKKILGRAACIALFPDNNSHPRVALSKRRMSLRNFLRRTRRINS